ncbi:MAG: hypothetical protein ABIZ91_01700, partial [Gemmatimonadaceae bacterium]
MDPESAVVKLCVLGIEAEAAGRRDEAAARFREAWDARSNDLEACIAAHYVARHQPSADETLRWNAVALELATRCDHDAVRTFYPSLYLNLAHSHEMQGDPASAAVFYR